MFQLNLLNGGFLNIEFSGILITFFTNLIKLPKSHEKNFLTSHRLNTAFTFKRPKLHF